MRELLYNAILALGSSMSLGRLHALGQGLGDAMWLAMPRRAGETACRVAERLGLDRSAARDLARISFRHSACSFAEIFSTRRVDVRFLHERIEYENPHIYHRFRTATKPVVAVSAHIGGWELMGGMIGAFAHKNRCQVVVRLPKDKDLAELILHMRSQPGIHVLPHRLAAQETLGHLRHGGMAAFLVDHNCKRSEAEFLPFLGEVAAVNKGPAILALRAKAEVWPFFLLRLPHGRYRAVTLPHLDTETLTGSRSERITRICRFYTEAVETVVRQYPEQWLWMHRRWKTRP
jgi:KDO2-lipid IV(A) lauroyltransferase